MLYRVHIAWAGFEHTTLMVIGTDCTGSCKSNNHTITTMMAPTSKYKFDSTFWWDDDKFYSVLRQHDQGGILKCSYKIVHRYR
jgi:hypothetical protein